MNDEKKKIYPLDHIEKYLMIDVLVIIVLVFNVFFEKDTIHWGIKAGFLLLFLASYYVGLWYRNWRLLVASLVGFSLLLAFGIYSGNWVILYGFVFADLLGRAHRMAIMIAGMAGIIAMFVLFSWIDTGNPFAFFSTLELLFMVTQLAVPVVVYTRRKANILKEKLAVANAQLERYIQEEERNRIARDLHDTLGQTLTMIKLKSELTMRLMEKNPEKAKHELHDILNTSRYALKQVRELVTDMKFISLKKEVELSKDILKNAGIELVVKDEGDMFTLSNVAETMLALSVREAITNIIKHSAADQCTITPYIETEYYCIQVSDNGLGNLRQGEGNGLQTMKERMTMLQGDMYMTASPGHGTVITLKVPLISNGRVQ